MVSSSSISIDAAVCCIALDEEPYIDEFIEHYLDIGFSKVYVYDNSDAGVLSRKLVPWSSKVKVVHFPGTVRQMAAYDHFVINFRHEHTHVCVVDVDEFVYLKKHKDIVEFLREYADADAIALNWVLFGSSLEQEYRDEPVVKRFVMCDKGPNQHVKVIAKTASLMGFSTPHSAYLKPGSFAIDTSRNPVRGPWNPDGPTDVAQINHYFTKSYGEYLRKMARGRADTSAKRGIQDFFAHDANHVFDDGLKVRKYGPTC